MCFLPDGIKLKPKKVYWRTTLISFSRKRDLNFFMSAPRLLNLMILYFFLHLLQNSSPESISIKHQFFK